MTTPGDSRRHRQTPNMANSSQRMALSANKNKNWRANYLRALNIFTPDLATPSRRHVPSGDGRPQQVRGRSDTRRRPTAAVPTTDEVSHRHPSSSNSRQSSRSGSSSRSRRGTSPSDDKASSTYVFGLRSHLFRARRLAPRSDLMVVDRVSAPIEIPTGTSATSPTADKLSDMRDSESRRRRGSSNDFPDKQPMVQLLSWEEPSVMLGSGGWPLESDKRDRSMSGGMLSRHDNGRLRRSSGPYSGIAEECEDTEDEDADGLTNTDDDDDIFKMEFDGDSNTSRNVFRGASHGGRRAERRPGVFDDFDDFDDEDDVVQPLSASFVPPHQMVERGCFSLGLRDELKRKPGVHI